MSSRPSRAGHFAVLVGLAGIVTLLACGRPTAAGSGEGTDDAAPDPVEANSITLLLNGKLVTKVGADALRKRPSLLSFLPKEARNMAAWKVLRARSKSGGFLRVPDPGKPFNDHVVTLYLTEDWPSIGVFRRLDASMSKRVREQLRKPNVFLVQTTEVAVWTIAEPAAPEKVMRIAPTLSVLGSNDSLVLTKARLSGLPRTDRPRDTRAPHRKGRERNSARSKDGGVSHRSLKRSRRPGWSLSDVVGLLLPAKGVAKVRLNGSDGKQLAVDGALLRSKEALVLVRYNRRGLMVVQLSGKDGEGKALTRRIRGVKSIEIERL